MPTLDRRKTIWLSSRLRSSVGLLVVLVVGACEADQAPPSGWVELQGEWTLASIGTDGFLRSPSDESRSPSLDLSADAIDGLAGRFPFSGSGGCNQISGRYRLLEEGRISIPPPNLTKIACVLEVMEYELQFVYALQRASTFEVDEATLRLVGDMGTLTFTRR